MKKLLTIFLATALLLPLTTSCVHEWPDEGVLAPVALDMSFSTDLPPFLTITYGATKNSSDIKAYDMRYTIEAYRRLPDGSYAETPHLREVLSKDEISTLDYTADILLPDGNYKVMVWADYVKQGSLENLYYDNTNFEEIVLVGEHVGNTDYRDAFVGFTEFEVRRVASDIPAPVHVIAMERPLAKFDIVAADIEVFITKQMELEMQRRKESETKGGDETKLPIDIDLNDYTVKVFYVGFMPFSFNMESNKPNDAKVGVSFESKIKYINDQDASLGFDYVMVNGKESIIQIALEVYDKNGLRIAATNTIDVPVIRSKLTTIKGEFLTSTAQGGVGIRPGFDGDFNIEFD